MIFNSLAFLLFLPAVLAIYYRLPPRGQNWFLLLASFFFYGWWDWRFLSLLFISTLIDFTVANRLGTVDHPGRRRWLLTISVVSNLGMLGFFKYFNFFAGSLESVLTPLGMQLDWVTLNIVLPVGISFYTFQTLSYTIDVYRRRLEPCRSLVDFALFVAFFPQLVAGPIERASSLLGQIVRPRAIDVERIASGLWLILYGYIMKTAIADNVAQYVDRAFLAPADFAGPSLVVAVGLFAVQIYADFAGYSSIARGTARLMGFELMVNFWQPYLAVNITDFWRRWHISLSTWLRDYLYIPLGGNRFGDLRTYLNLMAVMLIGGLWHGAAWNFVIWGGLHGFYLAVHKALRGEARKDVPTPSFISRAASTLFTFVLVCFAWIFFRARDFDTTRAFFGSVTSGWQSRASWLDPGRMLEPAFALALGGLIVLLFDIVMERRRDQEPLKPWGVWPKGLAYGLMICLVVLFAGENENAFIYFQF